MHKNSNICVFGGTGLVGSAIVRKLKEEYDNVFYPTRNECNLYNILEISSYLRNKKIEYVFFAAAKVGGILSNINYPAEFGFQNGMINLNIIHACYLEKIKKMLFLGSSCIYPKDYKQPLKEEYLLEGRFEPTNELYALSKVYGIKLCEAYNKQYGTNFISCNPSNIYGINDHFDDNSHVLSSIIMKMHNAKINNKEVTLWGTGTCKREFLYVDDCADACIFLMNKYDKNETINVGVNFDVTIKDLAYLISHIVGYNGKITFDTSKPDGMKQKLLDSSKINNLGWKHKIQLERGIELTYKYYLENICQK